MKRRTFFRIPLRRETLATRRLRARLCRERQGPDGKWETNKKKKEVRIVKKKCTKLANAFESMRVKRLEEEAAAFQVADELVAKLDRANKAASLRDILPSLTTLAVTATLLEKSPSLVDALTSAAKRCRKSKDETVDQLLSSWNAIREQRMQASNHPGRPRHRIQSKASNTADGSVKVKTVKSTAGSAADFTTCKPVTTASGLKPRANWKLGKLFAAMRVKNTALDDESIKIAKSVAIRLYSCGNAAKLRELVPDLESLSVNARVLSQTPSVLDGLTVAAKRCRQSKHETIQRLLSTWKELLPTRGRRAEKRRRIAESDRLETADSATGNEAQQSNQEHSPKINADVAPSERPNSAEESYVSTSMIQHKSQPSQTPPRALKQRKLSFFFNNSA